MGQPNDPYPICLAKLCAHERVAYAILDNYQLTVLNHFDSLHLCLRIRDSGSRIFVEIYVIDKQITTGGISIKELDTVFLC